MEGKMMKINREFASALTILIISTGLAAASDVSTAPKLFPAETKWTSASDWGSGTDASPAFTRDGKTVYFTHSDGKKRTIMVSHLQHGAWSVPKPAPFSGTWRDLEPAMAPDGSYLVFVSNRPSVDGGAVLDGHYGGSPRPGVGGNLWRVDRIGHDWSKPVRLPDVINSNPSVYAPAVTRNGRIYFMQADSKTDKFRLYRSQFTAGKFETPEPLSFSDGVIADYDPVVAPDESFIVFSSSRSPLPEKQNAIFVAFFADHHWKTPVPLRPFLDGIETRLSPDLKTLYFTADRPILEIPPATQNASTNPVPPIPQRIWQISLKSWSAVLGPN
jgi:Tol biopolymer transport system component